MDVSLFHYDLPRESIAKHLHNPPDECKLLVMDRHTGACQDRIFRDIVAYLRPGDVMVVNDTKVFRARLQGHIMRGGVMRPVEIFLLAPSTLPPVRGGRVWEIMARPGKWLRPDVEVHLPGNKKALVRSKTPHDTYGVEIMGVRSVVRYANRYGAVPLPPYIEQEGGNEGMYQTVYASAVGSVAAPTAGFHFTKKLLRDIRARGVQIVPVTLHVGMGTFVPMTVADTSQHRMHQEHVVISRKSARDISEARAQRRRIIAVGTTSVRTLEGVAALHAGEIVPFEGEVNLFITPGFQFRVVDGLITNFHLPESTLIVLVSAYAGREAVMRAYEHARDSGYLFYSFGDAMFITTQSA